LFFLVFGLWYLGQVFYFIFENLDGIGLSKLERFMSIYLLIHCAILSLFLIALLVVQIILISTGLTTVEFFKNYRKYRTRPFNEGLIMNWVNFWKTNRTTSNLTFEKIKMLQKGRTLLGNVDTGMNTPLMDSFL